jgi:hypothetical protein
VLGIDYLQLIIETVDSSHTVLSKLFVTNGLRHTTQHTQAHGPIARATKIDETRLKPFFREIFEIKEPTFFCAGTPPLKNPYPTVPVCNTSHDTS